MNTAIILHRMAMEFYDLARIYRAKGKGQKVFDEYRTKAWILSRQAALQMLADPKDFDFKHLVIASAGKVGYETGHYEESKRILELALLGKPGDVAKYEMNHTLELITKKYKELKPSIKNKEIFGILMNFDMKSNHIRIQENGKKELRSITVTREMIRDFICFYLGKLVKIQLDKDDSGHFRLKDIKLVA